MTTLSLAELTALHDIRRLKAQYAFFLDTKNWNGFRGLAYLHTTFLRTDDVTESHPIEKATISPYIATVQAAKEIHIQTAQ